MFYDARSGGNGVEELQPRCFYRSESPEIDDRSASSSATFKDVDMIFSLPNFYSVPGDAKNLGSPEIDRHGTDNQSVFEFQRVDRLQQRSSLPLYAKSAPSKWDDAQKWIASPNSSNAGKISCAQPRKTVGETMGRRNKPFSVKVMEFSDEKDSNAADSGQFKKDFSSQKAFEWIKTASNADSPVADSLSGLSQQGSSSFVQCASPLTVPPSTARSVSMRDTGTEMTPLASQEPSRTGTPILGPTPARSPSPDRVTPISKPVDPVDLIDKDQKLRTKREIMALGTRLGKQNITAWAGREVEGSTAPAAAAAVNSVPCEQRVQNIIEVRAAAWEEAEKAKFIARFKRLEVQIQAWEDHQRAKAEAESKKVEVKVERMKASAHEQLLARLATARLKAEEKRLMAEAQRNRRASKISQQVEYIRQTGRVPCLLSLCWGSCS
ncbi:remorin family protein [Wolffia australiana]